MIGGVDTIIDGQVDEEDLDVLLRLLRAGWPAGVCESSDGATVIPLRSAPGKRALEDEFFVYRDENSKASWDEHGLTDDNGEAMISVVIADDCIALVTGDLASESGLLVISARDTIHQLRLQRRLTLTKNPTASSTEASEQV